MNMPSIFNGKLILSKRTMTFCRKAKYCSLLFLTVFMKKLHNLNLTTFKLELK